MSYREINVTIKLQGWFPRIYNHNKPENLTDEAYVNAIVSSWLQERDEKNPVKKTGGKKLTYPCICGESHLKKKYADLHTQRVLNRIKQRNTVKEKGSGEEQSND